MHLDYDELENLTGCLKNCKYYTYALAHQLVLSDIEMSNKNEIWLEVTLAGSNVIVKSETLLFPWRSFISEFGGSLGLFLGFSFIMIWDIIETFVLYLKQYLIKE